MYDLYPLDEDQYPTEDFLLWVWTAKWEDPHALMECIRNAWWGADMNLFRRDGNTYTLITGGWSGNEDIIAALQESMFWTLYWESSHRGGKHVFVVRDIKVAEGREE